MSLQIFYRATTQEQAEGIERATEDLNGRHASRRVCLRRLLRFQPCFLFDMVVYEAVGLVVGRPPTRLVVEEAHSLEVPLYVARDLGQAMTSLREIFDSPSLFEAAEEKWKRQCGPCAGPPWARSTGAAVHGLGFRWPAAALTSRSQPSARAPGLAG